MSNDVPSGATPADTPLEMRFDGAVKTTRTVTETATTTVVTVTETIHHGGQPDPDDGK